MVATDAEIADQAIEETLPQDDKVAEDAFEETQSQMMPEDVMFAEECAFADPEKETLSQMLGNIYEDYEDLHSFNMLCAEPETEGLMEEEGEKEEGGKHQATPEDLHSFDMMCAELETEGLMEEGGEHQEAGDNNDMTEDVIMEGEEKQEQDIMLEEEKEHQTAATQMEDDDGGDPRILDMFLESLGAHEQEDAEKATDCFLWDLKPDTNDVLANWETAAPTQTGSLPQPTKPHCADEVEAMLASNPPAPVNTIAQTLQAGKDKSRVLKPRKASFKRNPKKAEKDVVLPEGMQSLIEDLQLPQECFPSYSPRGKHNYSLYSPNGCVLEVQLANAAFRIKRAAEGRALPECVYFSMVKLGVQKAWREAKRVSGWA